MFSSDLINLVLTTLSTIKSLKNRSLISRCFVLLYSKLFAKKFSPLLSQNNVIGDSILISKNSIIYLINGEFLKASFWATISASVLLLGYGLLTSRPPDNDKTF